VSELFFSTVATSWGAFAYVARGGRLLATYLPQSRAQVASVVREAWPQAKLSTKLLPSFEQDVREYFEGKRVQFRVGFDLTGLPLFRRSALEACARIPYGQTASYTDLARTAGNARAVRAAGGAMAHNPLPLVIPCHRVLRSDGTIGGFSSTRGVSEKLRLLRLEGAAIPASFESSLRRAV